MYRPPRGFRRIALGYIILYYTRTNNSRECGQLIRDTYARARNKYMTRRKKFGEKKRVTIPSCEIFVYARLRNGFIFRERETLTRG